MGRRELKDEHIRKLQRTGEDSASYMVTLPKEFIEKLSWREHQKVVVKLRGQTLTIADWIE